MNKIILLSFGTKNLIRSANRLRQQAKNFKIYDEILISNEDDIISSDKGKSYKNHAKSLALLNLNEIMNSISSKGNISSRAHKMHLKSIIEKALDND